MYAHMLRAAVIGMALLCGGLGALAQTVVQAPQYIDNSSVLDLGNGPLQIKVMQGNAAIFTSQASGVGSGSTTAITLTASAAANPPCVGCAISGGTLGPTSVVTAFNGTTGITVNTSQTIAASTPLSWGMACPLALGSIRAMLVQAAVGADPPLYTLARICGAAPNAPGATILTFPIGAH